MAQKRIEVFLILTNVSHTRILLIFRQLKIYNFSNAILMYDGAAPHTALYCQPKDSGKQFKKEVVLPRQINVGISDPSKVYEFEVCNTTLHKKLIYID